MCTYVYIYVHIYIQILIYKIGSLPQKLMAKLFRLVVVGHLASGESVDLLARLAKDKQSDKFGILGKHFQTSSLQACYQDS